MTTAVLTAAADLRDVLFENGSGDASDALAEILRRRHVAETLVPAYRKLAPMIAQELAGATNALLSLNPADVVAEGWKRFDALRKAAHRTRQDPRTHETVDLATHRIDSRHGSTIDVRVDGRTAATITVDLVVALTISGVRVVVRQGRVADIRSGACTVSGSLSLQRIAIAEREREFDLPGAIRLRGGVAPLEEVGARS
jgi:hypothetical protein